MDVLIMIWHPYAFVNSYKNLNWVHPWSHFLNQPLLMKEHLSPFEEYIREYDAHEYDLITQGAFLWKLINYMVLKYKNDHPDWNFIRHEDLSLDPNNGFKRIFDSLHIEFTARTRKMIETTIDPRNPIDPEDPYSIKRNSLTNVYKWQNQFPNRR